MGSYSSSGQDEEEVTVEVLVPAGTKSKDINVVFKPGHIRIQVHMPCTDPGRIQGSLGSVTIRAVACSAAYCESCDIF